MTQIFFTLIAISRDELFYCTAHCRMNEHLTPVIHQALLISRLTLCVSFLARLFRSMSAVSTGTFQFNNPLAVLPSSFFTPYAINML
mmetsp:Transcript_30173/g.63556  ORF Transcript_30173/g.63556 Transcript_30173/m.63556 type:complete len:87 (-) Transcript_30173:1185-1445(-)